MSHILIIEDEPKMGATLQKGLDNAGHTTVLLTNGMQARVEQISDYDLVILDWMLPGISGVDVLHFWRSEKKFLTPVMMLTAKEEVNDKVTALDFGADDYMTKFFEWPELLARINALTRRNAKPVVVGTITHDPESHLFFEKEDPVELTKTEYNLLKYFFDRPSRLITKASLLDHLYGYNFDPASNVVERHIHSIRTKFKYDPITTLRGVGYRLRTTAKLPKS